MSDAPVSGQTASAMLLAVSTSVATFTALLPPFAEVRKGNKADAMVREDVRMGELAASALVVGIGIMASGVAGSPAPAMATIVAALALVALYETALSK
jgi:hypothetical protein